MNNSVETLQLPQLNKMDGVSGVIFARKPFMRVGVEPKEQALFRIIGSDRLENDISVIIKRPEKLFSRGFFNDPNLTPAQVYYETYRVVQQAGLPVVPWLGIFSSDEVVLPDLRADGSGVYGPSDISNVEDNAVKGMEILWEIPAPTDALFAALPELDLYRSLDELAEEATRKGIGLPMEDACSLIVRLNGSYYPVILDLGEIELQPEDIKEHNCDAVSSAARLLIELQKFFRESLRI